MRWPFFILYPNLIGMNGLKFKFDLNTNFSLKLALIEINSICEGINIYMSVKSHFGMFVLFLSHLSKLAKIKRLKINLKS